MVKIFIFIALLTNIKGNLLTQSYY